MPRSAESRTAPASLGAGAFARNGLARLPVSFWVAVALGVVMIIWSTLLLPFVVVEPTFSARGTDPGDARASFR